MFDSIRNHQRLMQFVLLLLITPAFVFFGVSGYQRFLSDPENVADVGADHVTRQQLEQAQRNRIEQLREMLGAQLDVRMFDSPSARAETLEQLINQRVLTREAVARGIKVSDARVVDAMTSMFGLRRDDGTIDVEKYRLMRTRIEPTLDTALLGRCNVRPPAGMFASNPTEALLDAAVRCDLASQAMPDAITRTELVPQGVVDRIVALQEQTREVRDLAFKPEAYADQVKPTPEQLKKFYEDNARLYETPERAKVEYLVLDADALARQVVVDSQQLKTYYEQNASRFVTAEQRRASHILVKVAPGADDKTVAAARAKAEGLAAKARAGADFAALAKENSDDPGSAAQGGDLGFFTRDMMVKPFADAAWSLKPGEVSQPVQSEFGFHVIKLVAVNPGGQKSFEEVRSDIEADFRKQQAASKFAEAAETFTNTVYEQSDSLKPAAEKLSLTIRSADNVGRNGPVGGAGADAALANPKLLASLFSADSLRTKRNTEAVEVGGNRLASARIVEYEPAKRKPFEEVEADVRRALVDAEARKLAAAAGEARLKELRAGAEAKGFGESRTVNRTPSAQTMPVALDAIFKVDAAKLPAYVGADLGGAGYAIYQVTRVNTPDEKAIAEKRASVQPQVAQLLAQQELDAWLQSLKSRTRITRHLERVAGTGSEESAGR